MNEEVIEKENKRDEKKDKSRIKFFYVIWRKCKEICYQVFVLTFYINLIKPVMQELARGFLFIGRILRKLLFDLIPRFLFKVIITIKQTLENASFFVHRFEKASLSLQIWVTAAFIFLLMSILVTIGGTIS